MERRPSCTELANTPCEKRKSLPRSPLSGPVLVMFQDGVEPSFPNYNQPLHPKETSPQGPALELPQLVTSTAAEFDPQSPSSTSTLDNIEEYKIITTATGNLNATSLYGRCLRRL